MPRVRISEFKAKQLIYTSLDIPYSGISLNNNKVDDVVKNLPDVTTYVVKVDQGVKKRNKLGLIAVNISKKEIANKIKDFTDKGYDQFLIEEFVAHEESEERFLALERIREGVRVFYTARGGVNVEAEGATKNAVLNPENISEIASELGLESTLIQKILETFDKLYLSFLETNPFIVKDGKLILLDLAIEVDSVAEFFVQGAWSGNDFIDTQRNIEPEEVEIKKLQQGSSASFKLVVLNPKGSIFTIFSGGGASIVLADEIDNIGKGRDLANYAEYSGGPTEDETYIFTKNIISLALRSQADNKKIYIAGGVANFTDIRATFKGVIRALDEKKEELRNQNIKVYVRRGGPYQLEGLALMKDFLEKSGLLGEVMGPDRVITEVITTN